MEATFYLGLCLTVYLVIFSYVLYTFLEKAHVHYTNKLDIILTCLKPKYKKPSNG
jgi:hypothetical protein